MHVVALTAAQVPATQAVHVPAPMDDHVPALQLRQVLTLAPSVVEYCPAAQLAHVVETEAPALME